MGRWTAPFNEERLQGTCPAMLGVRSLGGIARALVEKLASRGVYISVLGHLETPEPRRDFEHP